MHTTTKTSTAFLLIGVMCLTPTTGFITSPQNAFGVLRNRNHQLFDIEDGANEWYTPPISSTPLASAIRRPVKTVPRETVISSAEQLQDFINPIDNDDRLTIVKYHASWCKSCARFALRLDKVKAEHADVIDSITGDVVTQGNIRFGSVEWGANEELCHAEGIEKLPTTRFYVNGVLQKEITGGAKKFQQHKDAIDYYLQKQQKRNRQASKKASFGETLNSSNAMIEKLLDQPLKKPLIDTTSFA